MSNVIVLKLQVGLYNHTDILSSFILPLFSYLKEEIFQEAKEVASCSVQYKKFWQHVAL